MYSWTLHQRAGQEGASPLRSKRIKNIVLAVQDFVPAEADHRWTDLLGLICSGPLCCDIQIGFLMRVYMR
jgi:hypothetical protein